MATSRPQCLSRALRLRRSPGLGSSSRRPGLRLQGDRRRGLWLRPSRRRAAGPCGLQRRARNHPRARGDPLRATIEQVLAEYADARARQSYGSASPMWSTFMGLADALGQSALTAATSGDSYWPLTPPASRQRVRADPEQDRLQVPPVAAATRVHPDAPRPLHPGPLNADLPSSARVMPEACA